jgi:hypothetical protein
MITKTGYELISFNQFSFYKHDLNYCWAIAYINNLNNIHGLFSWSENRRKDDWEQQAVCKYQPIRFHFTNLCSPSRSILLMNQFHLIQAKTLRLFLKIQIQSFFLFIFLLLCF